jgi:FMN phosphatase YigB (HAD superfamily)
LTLPPLDIEFVYFDLGNILLSFDPADACRSVGRRFGVSSQQARHALYDSGLEEQFEHGQLTPRQFAEGLRKQFDRSEQEISDAEIFDSISNMFVPIELMEGVLQKVKQSGCRVGLLSNTCHAHWDWIVRQQYRVMDFSFDATILSFEVGSMKPDSKIYQAAQSAAAAEPARILFLDDRHENVAAAINQGWRAQQCVGGESAVAVLRDHGCLDPASKKQTLPIQTKGNS